MNLNLRSLSAFSSLFSIILFSTGCATLKAFTEKSSVAAKGTDAPPSNGGLVWFPMSWNIRFQLHNDKEKSDARKDKIQLRNLGAVFKDLKTQKETFVQMSDSEGKQPTVTFDSKNTQMSFFAPYASILPPGNYSLEALRATHIDPISQKTIPLEIPVKNPFQTSGKPPIQFTVRDGRIAAVMRLAMQTQLTLKAGDLQAVTEAEPVDKEVVPVDVVLENLNRTIASSPLVYSASPDLPRSRVSITDEKGLPRNAESPVGRVGLLVDVPCKMTGMLKLIWKRSGDDREYFSQTNLSESGGDECESTKLLSPTLLLPAGDWWLKANYILTPNTRPATYRMSSLKDASDATKSYFSLGEGNLNYTNLHLEREIERQFVAHLADNNVPTAKESFSPGGFGWKKNILYLGRFELVPKSSQDGKLDSWDTLFKRNYTIAELKKHFEASEAFSAYTLDPLTKDRSKGTAIKSLLKVSSAATDAKKVEPFSAEFRKSATEQLAICIREREEMDPLVNISGTLNFTALRAGNGINVKNFTFDGNGISDIWVQECLQKKLLSFRFSNRIPSSFQGEMRFFSE